MGYDISWIIPRLRNPGKLWSCASSITVAVVGLFSKLLIELLNKTTVYNRERLAAAVQRPPGVPLITVSNHHSCFDDPGLWGVLDTGVLVSRARMRWSLAAHDICFTRALHACFFALGKCVPVVRGAGVYQPAMDFCVERLSRGEWVHIFPEGRVNVEQAPLRLKWGVGRLVADASGRARAPLVLPVWHEGMDRVLPNQEPYLLNVRKRVFLNVGEPIQISHLLERLKKANATEEETRKAITDRIQEELYRLRDRTRALIARAAGDARDVTADGTRDVTTDRTRDVTTDGTRDVTADGTRDVTTDRTRDVTTDGTRDVTTDRTRDVTADGTRDVTGDGHRLPNGKGNAREKDREL